TARVGTAEFAPGPGTGRPSPRAAPPRTSEHQQWVVPGGAAGGQGSQRSSRSGHKARSLPAQRIKEKPDTDEQSPSTAVPGSLLTRKGSQCRRSPKTGEDDPRTS